MQIRAHRRSRAWRGPWIGLCAALLCAAYQQPVAPGTRMRPVPLCAAAPTCPWPAESPAAAANLTAIEGPGVNDFHEDLSGAFWNPFEPCLWLCRNGGAGGSKIWKLVPDGANSFQVASIAGQRAEWTGFGDCEALALATFAEPASVFTIEEGSSSVREWDLSAPAAVLRRTWNLSAFVPVYAGGLGLEALAFVPDAALVAGAFVDGNGAPYTSTQGMGALAFVGHQNGGHVYVFDLNRTSGALVFVGEYATGDPELAELTFDPSLGVLYAWHGGGRNDLEILRLASVGSGPIRTFDRVLTYDYPGAENQEGFAVQWSPGGCAGVRGAFVTTDDGGANALRWFRQFPCGF